VPDVAVVGKQAESLFDEALPIEVRELPDDLAPRRAVERFRVGGADRGGVERRSASSAAARRSRWRCSCG
jgi:hypothetical protein